VRKAIAFTLSLALQVTALSAPLVHAHPDHEATHHHEGRTVHTHWAGHSSSPSPLGPSFQAIDDDRAVFLSVFVAEAASPVPAVALVPEPFGLPVPLERGAHPNVAVTHGHDPPSLGSLSPRAPPA
jgi:hypothetical protein